MNPIKYKEYYYPGGYPHPEKEAIKRSGYWITKDGRQLHVTEMEDSHLINTLRLTLRKAERWYEAWKKGESDLPGRTFTFYDIEWMNGADMMDEWDTDSIMPRETWITKCFFGFSWTPWMVYEFYVRGLNNRVHEFDEYISDQFPMTDAVEEFVARGHRYINGKFILW